MQAGVSSVSRRRKFGGWDGRIGLVRIWIHRLFEISKLELDV